MFFGLSKTCGSGDTTEASPLGQWVLVGDSIAAYCEVVNNHTGGANPVHRGFRFNRPPHAVEEALPRVARRLRFRIPEVHGLTPDVKVEDADIIYYYSVWMTASKVSCSPF